MNLQPLVLAGSKSCSISSVPATAAEGDEEEEMPATLELGGLSRSMLAAAGLGVLLVMSLFHLGQPRMEEEASRGQQGLMLILFRLLFYLGCAAGSFFLSTLLALLSHRSRLADFHTNCQASFQSLTSCPGDNYQACLGSYAGLIGFDITPNYIDSSTTSLVVSPSCSCRGSGNMEEDCERFLRDFTENPCLRNAIQAFGNGTDISPPPKNPPVPPVTLSPKVEKSPPLPDDINDSNTIYDTSMITTCTSIQEHGPKLNKSKEQSLCFSEKSLTTDLMPEQKTFVDTKGSSSRHSITGTLSALPFLLVKVAL